MTFALVSAAGCRYSSRSSVSVRTTSVNISEVYEAVPIVRATTTRGWADARLVSRNHARRRHGP